MATAQITLSEGVLAQVTVIQDTIELTGVPIPIQGVVSASNISLNISSFNNNLDESVTDVQKFAEAIDDMDFSQSIIDGGVY